MVDMTQLENAIWRIADGRGNDEDVELLRDGGATSLSSLARLIGEAEEGLASARDLPGDERGPVVADFTDTIASLRSTADLLRPPEAADAKRPPDEVVLQASWSAGAVVVWAGGRGAIPASNDGLATRLEACGGPAHGWSVTPGGPLGGGVTAEAVSIQIKDALGWLIAVSADRDGTGLGPSLRWLARVALEGVRVAARGAIVPRLEVVPRANGRSVEARVRWVPALTDSAMIASLASAMPGTVAALSGDTGAATTREVIGAVVEAIVSEGLRAARPPCPTAACVSPADLADTMVARMDGAAFPAGRELAKETSRRLDEWSRSVTDPGRSQLVVRLDPPGARGVWLLSVQAHAGRFELVPVATALRSDGGRTVKIEWARLQRMLPALDRSKSSTLGQVAMGHEEAWDFLSRLGPMLSSIGFDVRAPRAVSSRSAAGAAPVHRGQAGLDRRRQPVEQRLVERRVRRRRTERYGDRPPRPAGATDGGITRPVGGNRSTRSGTGSCCAGRTRIGHGVDRRRDPPPERRSRRVGLTASASSCTATVGPSSSSPCPRGGDLARRRPRRLRRDTAGLSGRGAGVDRLSRRQRTWRMSRARHGIGQDTDRARPPRPHRWPTVPSLVIAPAAVVGNWAAEADQFAPDLRVLVHHGAARATDRSWRRRSPTQTS